MKFRSFLGILTVGAVIIFLTGMVGLGWIASQSSANLLTGGVNHPPRGAVFLPKQSPVMVSLLTNPERLDGLRQVGLSLNKRKEDRQEWEQWESDLVAKIGFNYQRDFKPWLGEEVTFAIATLDGDRNPQNGVQPGYILAAETKNTKLAQESLRNFYSQQNNVSIEQYKGTNIIAIDSPSSSIWSSVVVGDFVLFANQSQLLKKSINQAQAVNLNLEQSDYYRMALNNIQQNQIGVGYVDIMGLSAWLDKSALLTQSNNKQILAVSLAIKKTNLAARTALIKTNNTIDNYPLGKSFLDNPELQQIFDSLPFDRHNSAYINLKSGKSLLEDKIPLYKVSKLALQSLFPHLKAIAIQNLGEQDNINRANILFKLDS